MLRMHVERLCFLPPSRRRRGARRLYLLSHSRRRREPEAKLLQMAVFRPRKNCFKWQDPDPLKIASNAACDPRKLLPILLAMGVASFQYWRRRRRAGSEIASNRGAGPPKIASNAASDPPKLLPILLAMGEAGLAK